MGMGPRINLYRIGGDPLTQLICFNYIFFLITFFFFIYFKFCFFFYFLNLFFFIRNADSDTINGICVVGDSMCANWCLNLILWVCRKLSSNML